ncbi:BON domain-containing protein [Usitatibacter palustris]|uniref:BON domain-containing protein n=1 Tax=Usitatibacter palustris TaxID=2732487 RepID=A0A6M4H4C8_9PROT|nr:BON domain-containing protein [Usitatibacter palustris]QJR14310.1 hypothetical protein DSM104440_01106 [Usitatibacter palustris]
MKASWIPAVLVAGIAAGSALAQLPEVQPQPAPKGTVAQSIDDATITTKVKEAIAADPLLKDVKVTVDTNNAVVILNGTAPAADVIARAVAVARAVPGVKSVTNVIGKPS